MFELLVALLIRLHVCVHLSDFLAKTFLFHLKTHSLVLELKLNLQNLFFLLCQLSGDFLNFVFQLILSLNYFFFAPFQLNSAYIKFALCGNNLLDRLIEGLLSNQLLLLPLACHLFYTLNLFLFQMHKEFSHLSALPHF